MMASVTSPDGEVIADWYELSGCGATDCTSDKVSIRRATDPFRVKRDWVFGAVGPQVLEVK